MGRLNSVSVLALFIGTCLMPHLADAQLDPNFYATTCPNVESTVRKIVQKKIRQTFVTVPATLRLFFHDCFVNGCDASVMIASTTANNKTERDHADNLSLAGDGFDVIIKAKQALDSVPSCKNKVSCSDILTIATRDVVYLAGGPFYPVELGRRDGLLSSASSVHGRLPKPTDDLDKLTALFAEHGLTQADMIALSAAHTVGFAHCSKFRKRLYNYSANQTTDPTIDPEYATKLKAACPKEVDPRIAIDMDPNTPTKFDNFYYKNLAKRKGLFTSDQVLYEDPRSKPLVVDWATNRTNFEQAFVDAITKLGRVGVKTGTRGNIRIKCDAFN